MQSVSLFIVIVITTLCSVLLAVALVLFCYLRLRRVSNCSSPNRSSRIYHHLEFVDYPLSSQRRATPTMSTYSLDHRHKVPTEVKRTSSHIEKRKVLDLPESFVFMAREPRSRPIPLTKFMQRFSEILTNPLGIQKEFSELDAICTSTIYNNEPLVVYSHGKDKYRDILPYAKHSLVKLEGPVSYINASFIAGSSGPREYISTQSPMHATRNEFFRMLLQYHVSIVVTLNKYAERKCFNYFPGNRDEPEICELDGILYKVSLIESQMQSDDIAINTIHLTNSATNEMVRAVRQFHFQSWRDFGTPSQTVLDLIESVRLYRQILTKDTPVVVHCSAGVGRSGVFIALDQMWHKITMALKDTDPEDSSPRKNRRERSTSPKKSGRSNSVTRTKEDEEPSVDIFGTVYKLRMFRKGMVQTGAQYEFLYDTIEHILTHNRLINYQPNSPKVWNTRL